MAQHDILFGEIIYDLSYLGGVDDLLHFVEDSRNLYEIIRDWAEEFDKKYPMPEDKIVDFSELYNVEYLTAIDNFYIEKRNELMAEWHNITSKVVLNTIFKIKC